MRFYGSPWEGDGKGRSLADGALHRDVPSMEGDDFLCQGQPDPASFKPSRGLSFHLGKTVENMVELIGGNTDAVVPDRDGDLGIVRREREPHLAMLESLNLKALMSKFESTLVILRTSTHAGIGWEAPSMKMRCRSDDSKFAATFVTRVGKIDAGFAEVGAPALKSGELEQFIDEEQ